MHEAYTNFPFCIPVLAVTPSVYWKVSGEEGDDIKETILKGERNPT
jgi:hypothetical protein